MTQTARGPRCADCGSKVCRPVHNGLGAYTWLCGSCEYLRDRPDAPTVKRPSSRRKPSQSERLFPPDEPKRAR